MTIDNNNYKPYRTQEQKKIARATAVKKNGTWVSNAPKSYHKTKSFPTKPSKVRGAVC